MLLLMTILVMLCLAIKVGWIFRALTGHPPADGWTSGGYKYFDFAIKWQHLEYEVVEDLNGVVFLRPCAYYIVADVDISLYVPLNNKSALHSMHA